VITQIKVRPNAAGVGWFVLVTIDGEERAVGGTLPHAPIIDMTLVMAEVAKQTAAMLLGREEAHA